MPKVFKPLDHFNYRELDTECSCRVCSDWRLRLEEYKSLEGNFREHGSITSCKCGDCKKIRFARSLYVAANARRDLYCEGSWHAAADHNTSWGSSYMEWLGSEIAKAKDSDRGWWEARASDLPLFYWFRKFNAFAMAVSGCVPIEL